MTCRGRVRTNLIQLQGVSQSHSSLLKYQLKHRAYTVTESRVHYKYEREDLYRWLIHDDEICISICFLCRLFRHTGAKQPDSAWLISNCIAKLVRGRKTTKSRGALMQVYGRVSRNHPAAKSRGHCCTKKQRRTANAATVPRVSLRTSPGWLWADRCYSIWQSTNVPFSCAFQNFLKSIWASPNISFILIL